MKKIGCFLLITTTLVSCKNQQASDISAAPTKVETLIYSTQNKTQNLELGCYIYDNKDKIHLEITEISDSIKGTLEIEYVGKDVNKGSFSGILRDNKLIAYYQFHSEGVLSKRQIALSFEDGNLFMGHGAMDKTGTSFSDLTTVQYDTTIALKKTDCTP